MICEIAIFALGWIWNLAMVYIGWGLGEWYIRAKRTWPNSFVWIWRFMIEWERHPGLWIGFYDKHLERCLWEKDL